MRLLYVFLVAFLCVSASLGNELKCKSSYGNVPQSWRDMVNPCIEALEKQVKVEIRAALTYLSMGAYFAQDTVNRPGFSKFFFESANEERQHAIKIIEYLLMRGQLTDSVSKLLQFPLTPKDEKFSSGVEALKSALRTETGVTRNIQNIIMICEKPSILATNETDTRKSENDMESKKNVNGKNLGDGKNKKENGMKNNQRDVPVSSIDFNDYHLVDYLTGEFLDEQYKGQRDLAGKITTLNKMMASHGALGEFLFDKKLLYGEI